jgi:hypothetical protein
MAIVYVGLDLGSSAVPPSIAPGTLATASVAPGSIVGALGAASVTPRAAVGTLVVVPVALTVRSERWLRPKLKKL